jgi:hypothetical protein
MGTDQEHASHIPDPRAQRLWDVRETQRIKVTCQCGQTAHFLPGFLQRRYRLPSDLLVHDLKFRLRCSKCRSKDRFTVIVIIHEWPPS